MVRALSWKQEYLDFYPRTHKETGHDCVYTCIYRTQGIDTEGIWDCWPTAQVHVSHTHNSKGIKLIKTPNIVIWPLHNHTNMLIFYTQTYKNTHQTTEKKNVKLEFHF